MKKKQLMFIMQTIRLYGWSAWPFAALSDLAPQVTHDLPPNPTSNIYCDCNVP